ncbi:tripartite tricarboxylate transporter substrate-binding protein [Azohydromonas sp.]|uniref:tripartite tricarboxylate transporter substrate-binding protein n=1 Tax=Azohydromonas sp. TaxID=1872666 RepID=UPI002C200E34|nr:tripartite tricarboxylate transporter substrate-binding protein [Azohydromonas sp.]HMM86929.1 tripartite tricarboxylate transporter substrate-binding protein [Azohydromonas sp.]
MVNLTRHKFGLVVPASAPWQTLRDFVEDAKKNSGKIDYGSTGTGTTPHLAVEEFAAKAGIKLTHVPFKGSADLIQAILGGHIMVASDSTGWAPHVAAGKLRLLATYGSKRTTRWPGGPGPGRGQGAARRVPQGARRREGARDPRALRHARHLHELR